MTHVMSPAIGNTRSFESLLPGFFDIDATEGRFTGKDERFLRITRFVEALQFSDNRI
jgi:hypothetical protein